jgi:hypothetical protein
MGDEITVGMTMVGAVPATIGVATHSAVASVGAVVLAGMAGIVEVVTSVAAAVTVVVFTLAVAVIAVVFTSVAAVIAVAATSVAAVIAVAATWVAADIVEVGATAAIITRSPARFAQRGGSDKDKAEAPTSCWGFFFDRICRNAMSLSGDERSNWCAALAVRSEESKRIWGPTPENYIL